MPRGKYRVLSAFNKEGKSLKVIIHTSSSRIEKEQLNKSKASRRQEIIKTEANTNEIENKNSREKLIL